MGIYPIDNMHSMLNRAGIPSKKIKSLEKITVRKVLTKNWLVYKIANKALSEAIKKYARGKLLDIGCAEKPYEKMTKSYITQYIGVDHKETFHDKSNIDRFGTAYDIPAKDGEFDTALCTAVLEHLEEPDKAIKEVNRILKKAGYAIYTVPLFWHLHEEPRDFYRYTKYGLKYLFEKNGFEIVEIKPLSGFIVTFSQELVYFLRRFRRGILVRWGINILSFLIQRSAYFLNQFDDSHNFTWMYLIVVTKR